MDKGCLERQGLLLKRCRSLAAGKEDRKGEALQADRPGSVQRHSGRSNASHLRNQQ